MGHVVTEARIIDRDPERLPCVGGPLHGEAVSGWQRRDDTYEVFQVSQTTNPRTKQPLREPSWNARERTRGIWASDLRYTFAPAGARLGHYRLNFAASEATWVPA